MSETRLFKCQQCKHEKELDTPFNFEVCPRCGGNFFLADYQPPVDWKARAEAAEKRAEKAEDELKENAQTQLLHCMSDFSEETYCAGWLLGIEDACKALVSGELKNGFGMLGPGDELDEWKQKMTELHDRAGGWWKWDDTENKEIFVPDRWIP